MKYYFIFILSGFSLLIERIWNNFWGIIAFTLISVSLALLDISKIIPPNIFILFFLIGLVFLINKDKNTYKKLSISDIKRKIEITNNLEHRPLDTISDNSINNSPLWALHLKQSYNQIKKISQIYTPNFTAINDDKFAIRHIATIFLLITLIIVPKDNWIINIKNNFKPDIALPHTKAAEAENINVWIQLPEYTNRPAMFILSGNKIANVDNTLNVLEGSILKANASGYKISPTISYQNKKYKVTDSTDNMLSINLSANDTLKISSLFKTLYKKQINIVKDTSPHAEIKSISSNTLYATKISYALNDDYGVTEAFAIFKPTNPNDKEKDISYKFPINIRNDLSENYQSKDLTSNIWSGKEVEFFIRAKDNFGNVSESNKVIFTLPEREFNNKFSQKIAEHRKLLIESDNPKLRQKIAINLAEIAIRPDLYKRNLSTFLALSVAIKRIVTSHDNNEILNLLWDIAMQLEDGGLKSSQQKLYQALQDMQNSLSNPNMTDKDKQALADNLQAAIEEYVQALSNEIQNRLQQGKSIPSLPAKIADKLKNSINMKEILEQLRNISNTNSYEDMLNMAEKLKNSLENFDIDSLEKMQKKQAEALENLNKLENIIKSQQELLNKTNLSNTAEKLKALEPEQSLIKNNLSKVIKNLSKNASAPPEKLTSAHLEMNSSADSLNKGFGISSSISQEKAIKLLQEGEEDLAQQIAKSIKDSLLSFSFMPRGSNFGENYDPLGRKIGTDDIKIPTQNDAQETKKILDELRKRANNPYKNIIEKQYLERLIH